MLTHGELFAGVSGIGLGFERAGIPTRWHVEIDRDCRDVLRYHYPDSLILEDVRECDGATLPPVDIISFGSPCQDMSVAGRRTGLGGERSGLFYEAVRIIKEMRDATGGLYPTFALWENVPGALSSSNGHDFAAVLDSLADIGSLATAWSILDAQWFGVPQRRRRVFVVCDFAGERASQILALPEGLQGHPAPRREAGKDVAAGLTSGSHPNSNRPGRHSEDDVNLVAGAISAKWAKGTGGPAGDECYNLVAHALSARPNASHREDSDTYIAHSLTGVEPDASEDGTGRGTPIIAVRTAQTSSNGWGINEEETSYTLDGAQGQAVFTIGLGSDPLHAEEVAQPVTGRNGDPGVVAFAQNQRGKLRTSARTIKPQLTTGGGKPGEGYPAVAFTERTRKDGRNLETSEDMAYALTNPGSGGRTHSRQLMDAMGVRRLTPTECERLMSWEDGHTALGASGKEMSDSTRYRMCGNGVVSNVAEWIARRIAEVRDV